MTRSVRAPGGSLAALLLGLAAGCGTTRMSDSARTGTEQLLISNAVDHSVSQLDFRALCGKPVFFDPQYLDTTVDKGYVVSSLRQQLLASGCVLQEERAKVRDRAISPTGRPVSEVGAGHEHRRADVEVP